MSECMGESGSTTEVPYAIKWRVFRGWPHDKLSEMNPSVLTCCCDCYIYRWECIGIKKWSIMYLTSLWSCRIRMSGATRSHELKIAFVMEKKSISIKFKSINYERSCSFEVFLYSLVNSEGRSPIEFQSQLYRLRQSSLCNNSLLAVE